MGLSKTISILFLITSLYDTCFCQVRPIDSATLTTRIHDTYTLYVHTIAGASLLNNGAEYLGAYQGIKGFPFFETNDFANGYIYYNGIRYNDIALKYDLVTNEVIIKDFRNRTISLVRENIDSFYIMKHLFVRIADDSINLRAATPLFYDLLYDGKNIKFLATRKKIIKQALRAEDPSSFVIYNTYYLVLENIFYSVTTKKKLIRLLGVGNDAMEAFWRNNAVNLKKDAEASVRKAVEYYDQLKSNHE